MFNEKKSAPNCPLPPSKINDFDLKYCILIENAKNTNSGRSPYSR
jgi:hypothetical protein